MLQLNLAAINRWQHISPLSVKNFNVPLADILDPSNGWIKFADLINWKVVGILHQTLVVINTEQLV